MIWNAQRCDDTFDYTRVECTASIVNNKLIREHKTTDKKVDGARSKCIEIWHFLWSIRTCVTHSGEQHSLRHIIWHKCDSATFFISIHVKMQILVRWDGIFVYDMHPTAHTQNPIDGRCVSILRSKYMLIKHTSAWNSNSWNRIDFEIFESFILHMEVACSRLSWSETGIEWTRTATVLIHHASAPRRFNNVPGTGMYHNWHLLLLTVSLLPRVGL